MNQTTTRVRDGAIQVEVRVATRASRVLVSGARGGRLVVRVTAAPVDGEANDAVLCALADALDVPRRSLKLVAGRSSKNKTVEISSPDPQVIAGRIARLAG